MTAEISALLAAAVCVGLAALGEYWHGQRSAGVARLAYGPEGKPLAWTKFAPFLRVLSVGLLAWGLAILVFSEQEAVDTDSLARDSAEEEEVDPEDIQRVILAIDISPSMNAIDAGPKKEQRRKDRLMDVVEGVLGRIALTRTRFTVVVFFTSARAVVQDARDTNVVRNIMDNLPLVWSFKPGKTELLSGVEKAGEMAADWPPESTTLFLCTDGDTVDFNQIPELPRSIKAVEILAVGDPLQSTKVGNHESRQQAAILKRLAIALGGNYHDVNTQHMPTEALADLSRVPPPPPDPGMSLKELARIAVLAGALVLGILPVLLEYAGAKWKPHRELPSPAITTTRSPSA